MKILCKDHYDKVVQYAKRINDSTLQNCLARLENWEKNNRSVIELCCDFAPYSFLFRERYKDGRIGIVGGLVYHGDPDQSYCYAEPRIHGWAIHT